MYAASETKDARTIAHDKQGLRLAAAVMLRNEGDIIQPFLRQCAELFDDVFIADVCATDGTAEALRNVSDPRLNLHVFQVVRQERYQSALINVLCRRAFLRGADWVFCLDGDEFLGVGSRSELENALIGLRADVLTMPWINLVPTSFGSFSTFDSAQTFHWSGETSAFSKVALSRVFAANNPDFYVLEGNHGVCPHFGLPEKQGQQGLSLLHVPVRSIERLRYKIGLGLRLVRAKHNRFLGEGYHADILDGLLNRGAITAPELRFLAANYGRSIEMTEALDPVALGWPTRRLPNYVYDIGNVVPDEAGTMSLSATQDADALITWDRTAFVKDSIVGAVINGGRIDIVPQALTGGGAFRVLPFAQLPLATISERFDDNWLTEVVAASCTPIRAWKTSAWSELVPVMSALFALLRPRRYVELGVYNGMSFFAACQIVEELRLSTDCVAIDSWIGDEHAGFHDHTVLDNFRVALADEYPNQCYINGFFANALQGFEAGSIDLLHIDGLHIYEAVRDDFQSWLPKMSDVGVVILHDTNEFDLDFGVWRLWDELKQRYPAYEFVHGHGLGILYVGKEPHPFAALLRQLTQSRREGDLAQVYFKAIGELLTNKRRTAAALEAERERFATQSEAQLTKARDDSERLNDLQSRYDAVVNSSTWRLTAPVRMILTSFPQLRRFVRRGAR